MLLLCGIEKNSLAVGLIKSEYFSLRVSSSSFSTSAAILFSLDKIDEREGEGNGNKKELEFSGYGI